MNWYKKSFQINNLEDRNLVNARIAHLEGLMNVLNRASKIVHQTQRGAQNIIRRVMADKRMSSFPNIISILDDANGMALDSPQNFEILCKKAIEALDNKVRSLKKERKEYTKGRNPKGWF